MDNIKTRDHIRNVKTFDRAKNFADRTVRDATKTKDNAQEAQAESTQSDPTQYATDTALQKGKTIAHHALRRPMGRAQRTRHKLQLAKQETREAYSALRKSGKAENPTKTPAGKTARKTANKTVKQAGKASVKTAKATGKTVKGAAKGAKVATKSAVTATKASAKGAVVTAKAAKLALMKTRLLIIKAKLTIKAVIATVKLVVIAVKSLAGLIAVGGWVVVLIIILVGIILAYLSSPAGIFYSGEDDPELGRSMPEVVMELTQEFHAQTDEIAARVPHDRQERANMHIRWDEVLAVYAVKLTTDDDFGMDVVTLDDERVDMLRGVLHDMATMGYAIRVEVQEQTVTNEDGEERVETISIRVLLFNIEQKMPDEMVVEYGFSAEQHEMLQELLHPDNAMLWAQLLGGFSGDGGDILTGYENMVSLGMFNWMFEGRHRISSHFGWRTHPIHGDRRHHNGLDIAAPRNTPILAMADGTVVVANGTDSWGGGWGYHVIIEHVDGYRTIYAHANSISVVRGQAVRQGEVIAHVGTTGSSTGYHLHVEVRLNGTPVDPLRYFRAA